MENLESICDEYEDATLVHSLPQQHTDVYQKLIVLGQRVVPFILRRFKQGRYNAHWFLVLEEITGQQPLPPPPAEAQEGGAIPGWVAIDVEATARAWLAWGKAEGHVE